MVFLVRLYGTTVIMVRTRENTKGWFYVSRLGALADLDRYLRNSLLHAMTPGRRADVRIRKYKPTCIIDGNRVYVSYVCIGTGTTVASGIKNQK